MTYDELIAEMHDRKWIWCDTPEQRNTIIELLLDKGFELGLGTRENLEREPYGTYYMHPGFLYSYSQDSVLTNYHDERRESRASHIPYHEALEALQEKDDFEFFPVSYVPVFGG